MHYILFYEVVDNYLEKRKPFRAEHIELARKALARGELILAGDLADPAYSAILIFSGSHPGAAEEFAENDNYVKKRPDSEMVGSKVDNCRRGGINVSNWFVINRSIPYFPGSLMVRTSLRQLKFHP